MSASRIEATPYGARTVAVFGAPFTRRDFAHMEAIIGDLTMGGFTPLRFLEEIEREDLHIEPEYRFRIVVTSTGVALP